MKRPVLLVLTGAAAGAFLGWVTELPLLFFVPCMLCFFLLPQKSKKYALIFLLAFTLAFLQANRQKQTPWQEKERSRQSATLRITEVGRKTDYTQNYGAVMVTEDYKEAVQLQTSADAKPLFIGDIIRTGGSFRRPDRTQNDGLFSYGDYLLRHGKKGLFRADSIENIGVSDALQDRVRRDFYEKLHTAADALFPPRTASVLTSVLGGSSTLSPEEEEAYRDLGVSHLFAVSGLHIGLLFGLLLGVLGPLTGKYAARILALLLVAFYIYLIGFPVSAVRAFIMALVLVLARSLRASYDPLTALFFAASVILLLFPGSVVDAGFHLSFAGVWSVVWVRKVFLQKMGREHSLLLSSLAIQMGILPALLLHFWRAPLAGLLANLLLIPLFSFFVGAGAFAIGLYFVFVPLTSLLAGVAQTAGTAFFTLSDSIGSLTIPVLQFFWVGPVTVAWIYLLFYLYLRPQTLDRMPYAWKKAVFCSVLSTFLVAMLLAQKKESILFIDIGQGDAALIQTGTRAYLIDTGGEIRDDQPDSLERILLPSLAREGVRVINGVFVSHFDADHIENLRGLAQKVPIQAVYIPDGLRTDPAFLEWHAFFSEQKIPCYALKTGQKFALSADSRIEVLHDARFHETNDSLVLRYNKGNTGVLFPGDLEASGEQKLQGDLSAEILKAGHHGSASSTSEGFLAKVNPERVLITAGYNNPYGHPHPDVLKQLKAKKIPTHRTDQSGNIRIRFFSNGYQIQSYPTGTPAGCILLSCGGFLPLALWTKDFSRRHYATQRIPKQLT